MSRLADSARPRKSQRPSPGRLAAAVVFAPMAAIGWASLALLGLVTSLVIFRQNPSQGVVALLWGLLFAILLWAGGLELGLSEVRAIPFALVAAASIALFVYLRGAALENPPVGRPGVFHRRLLTRWLSTR